MGRSPLITEQHDCLVDGFAQFKVLKFNLIGYPELYIASKYAQFMLWVL